MPTVAWITGAGGLIGSHLARSAAEFAPEFSIRPLTRADLELSDFVSVRDAFQAEQPSLVIHCAALSKSPVCQQDPELAWRSNVEVTRLLSELAEDRPFIFFSSDLVFDGRKGQYDEADALAPLSVYGETKAAAEKVVLANPRHTVIRTSLNGGPSPTGDRGFNEQLRGAWQKGQVTRLFTDEYRSPLPAQVTARAVWEIARANLPGVFHVAGSERLSRWEIGQCIAARWPELNPKIEPVSSKEYTGAPRPPDTSLSCNKVQQILSFPLPGLTEWLESNRSEVF